MGTESTQTSTTEQKQKVADLELNKKQGLLIISLNRAFNSKPEVRALPSQKTETTDSLKRKQRIDSYKQSMNYVGFPPKQVTDSIANLNATNEARKAERQHNYIQADSYSRGAENAFSLALNKADPATRGKIKEVVMLDAFSFGDTKGIDFLVVMQDGSQWGFDVKTSNGIRSDKVNRQIVKYKDCKVSPIYKDGLLDAAATTQMLVDLIEEAREQIT